MPTVRAWAPSSGDRATTKSDGSAIVLPSSLQKSRISRASGDLVLFEQGPADREPDRAHEVVGHAAAEEERVGAPRERAQGVDLAGDLRAAEDRRERPFRVEEPRQGEDFPLEEETGALFRHERRDADDGRMRAVGRAEGVVHVHVGQRREALRELGVVGLLARMEPQVFQQQDLARRERRGQPSRLRAPRNRLDEPDGPAELLGELHGHRR